MTPIQDLKTLVDSATTPFELLRVLQGYEVLRWARASENPECMRVALDSVRRLAPESKNGEVWIRLSRAMMMHMSGDKISRFDAEAVKLIDMKVLERTTTGTMN